MIPDRIRSPLAGAAACVASALILLSCGVSDKGPAELWTDVPELALAVELFNASQPKHIVQIAWKADLAEAIKEAAKPPSLAIGRFLKSQDVRDRFQSLDYLFGELVVNQSSFYPALLALGMLEGRQLLLPVSFNLPAVIFPEGESRIPGDFMISLADMAGPAAAFNQKDKRGFIRMGFSPRWDGDFLTLEIDSAGAGFKEGKPLAWSDAGLSAALDEVRSWVARTNGSAAAEDEFQFKYLYTPAYQYVVSGRTLFAYVDSSRLFLIPEEKRAELDYRWFARGDKIRVSDDIVYAAILRSAGGKQAAEAFLSWLFREESQKAIMESARRTRALESSFGLAEGFSSIRSVNERVFPLFYPALVGHMPPADSLYAPNILPNEWAQLKSDTIAPWLVAATAAPNPDPSGTLSSIIAENAKKSAKP
jgi:hypothetical protein